MENFRQKSFLKLLDFTPEEIGSLLDLAADLKAKKKYAAAHSTFRTDVRDTCTVSYVGQMDWGGMQTISIRSTPLRMETWSLKSMPFRISSVSVFR